MRGGKANLNGRGEREREGGSEGGKWEAGREKRLPVATHTHTHRHACTHTYTHDIKSSSMVSGDERKLLQLNEKLTNVTKFRAFPCVCFTLDIYN